MYQFSDKTDNFEFLGPNLPKNRFWGQNFKNLRLDSESASLRYVYQFSDKTDNFEFLGPNLPKNRFWGRNFKSLSLEISPIELLTRKQNNKSLAIELVTRNEFKYFSTLS